MKRLLILCLSTMVAIDLQCNRSIHRSCNPTIPYITVTTNNDTSVNVWQNQHKKTNPKKINKFQNKFLRLKTLKKPFANSGFKKYMLPNGNIKFRRNNDSVHSNILRHQNEIVLEEILQGKKEFTHFTILKDRDFNYNNISGLIILKYKDYPFVLKLFIEHPETFIEPLNKSFEASWIFILSGNMRHLSGFTRIHNLENAKRALAKDPEYRYYIDFPRKWYWMPQSQPTLDIHWHDPYHNHFETIKLPGMYGIICDFIDTDTQLQQQEIHTLRQISIDVTNYLHYIIDPHVDNFVPEKNSHKIVIIDTEHFPTVAGLDKEMNANGYIQWYIELIGKGLKTTLLRSKQARIHDQCKL